MKFLDSFLHKFGYVREAKAKQIVATSIAHSDMQYTYFLHGRQIELKGQIEMAVKHKRKVSDLRKELKKIEILTKEAEEREKISAIIY